MFRLFFLIVIITLIACGGYVFYTQPALASETLKKLPPNLFTSFDSGKKSVETAVAKLQTRQPEIMGITSEAGKIFQEDTNDKPLHQKAMDFAQYQYCVQVVKQYETTPTITASPSATPDEENDNE